MKETIVPASQGALRYEKLIDEGNWAQKLFLDEKIDRLNQRAVNELSNEDIANTARAVQSRLTELGVEAEPEWWSRFGNGSTLAQAVTAVALEREAARVGANAKDIRPTKAQRKMVAESKVAQRVLSEMDVGNLRGEAYAGLVSLLSDPTQEEFTRATAPYARTNDWVKNMSANKLLAADIYGQNSDAVTVTEADKAADVKLDGESVKIVGMEGKQVRVKQGDEIKAVDADELKGLPDSYRELIDAAGTVTSSTVMLNAYRPGQDVAKYARAWSYAEDIYGAQTNRTFDELRDKSLLSELTDEQLKMALDLGRKRYEQNRKTEQSKAEERKKARDEAKARGAEKRKKGTVTLSGAEVNGKTYKGVDEKKLNTQQKKIVAMIRTLADAVNIDYVVYDGDANEGGSYISGGTIMININSGAITGKYLGAATLSHELTHYMKDFAPEDYLELKDYIVSEILNKSPAQFDRLVRNQMKIEKGLSYDGAVDEVIANACQTMLLNSKAVTKLARQNMDLAEKIRDYIGETAEKFKAAFEEVDVNDDISLYEAVRAISDVYDNVLKLWDKALLAANENYNAEQATGKKNTAENGGVQNMYFGEQAREADMTALETARSMEENGTDAETIRKDTGWFRGMDGKWRFEIDDSRIKWESAGDIQFREDHPEYDEYRNLLDKMCNSPEFLTEDEQKRLVELDDMWSGELSRLSQRVKNGRVKLGNVLRHESLFRNYPELKDILVEYADLGPASGRLLPMTGDGNAVIQINRNLKSDPRSTLVHEIQHAIQYIEGFTPGSNPSAWETKGWQRYEQAQRYVDAVERERESLFDNDPFFEELERKVAEGKITDSEYIAQAEAHMKENTEYERLTLELNRAIARAAAYKRNRNATELYRNTAGEIEARDVQYRQRYDEEKRRNTPPDLGDENTVFADASYNAVEQTGMRSASDTSGEVQRQAIGSAQYTEYAKPITMDDVRALRTINNGKRISVNMFTSEDLQKTQKWASLYFRQMGNKSPFFRAWFGDWRAQDRTPISVANVPKIAAADFNDFIKKQRSPITGIKNNDTGLTIRTSEQGEANTESHSGHDKKSVAGLAAIRDLIQNGVLLDSEIHEYHNTKRYTAATDPRAFNHRLYALGMEDDGSINLYRINFEDRFQDPKHTNDLLFHNLMQIDVIASDIDLGRAAKKEAAPAAGLTEADKQRAVSRYGSHTTSVFTVADLYRFVKQYDTDFNVNPHGNIDPALLNKDGSPKVFYHSTDAPNIDVFQSGNSAGLIYFAETEKDAKYAARGTKHVKPYYLTAQKPVNTPLTAINWYDAEDSSKAAQWRRNGYDAVFVKDEAGVSVAVFAPEQIKSATDNIGTFDKTNPDVHMQRWGIGETAEEQAVSKERFDRLRAEKNAKIEEVRKAEVEKRRAAVAKEKAAKWEKVEETKDYYRDMMKRQRDKRSDTAMRGKIKDLHKELSNMLLKPSENRYVPKQLVKATAEILNAVDITSGKPTKASAAFAELRTRYDALQKEPHYAMAYDETVSGMLQNLAETVGDGNIYELTGDSLDAVYTTLKALQHTIKTANKLVGTEIEKTATEVALQMIAETRSAKEMKSALKRFYSISVTNPRVSDNNGHTENCGPAIPCALFMLCCQIILAINENHQLRGGQKNAVYCINKPIENLENEDYNFRCNKHLEENMKKLFAFVVIMALALSLAACGTVPPADNETPAAEPQSTETAEPSAEDDGRAAPSETDEPRTEAPESPEPAAETGRQDGERYEGVIVLEGMERTVRYEHIVNKTAGFEMDYDYETFVRHSEEDREIFVLAWDNDPSDPEYYLEVTCSTEDAETVAAAIGEELSKDYEINRGSVELERAGGCIRIGASEVKGGGYTADQMQTVYIIPADDGCRIATAHYGADSSDLFGARFRAMVNTLSVIAG